MSQQKYRRRLMTGAFAVLAFLSTFWSQPAISKQSPVRQNNFPVVAAPLDFSDVALPFATPIGTPNPLLAPALAQPSLTQSSWAQPSIESMTDRRPVEVTPLAGESTGHSAGSDVYIIASASQGSLQTAQALNEQAIQEFSQGEPEAAIATWQAAQQQYEKAGDTLGSIGTQINQAQALQTIGLYRRARALMEGIRSQLESQPESEIAALGYQSLGGILQATGYLQESEEILQRSLAIAQAQNLDPSATLITLGNTHRALQKVQAAQQSYRQAAETAIDPMTRVEAQLNWLSLWIDQNVDQSPGQSPGQNSAQTPNQKKLNSAPHLGAAQSILREIQNQLPSLEPSRRSTYAQVNLAAHLIKHLQSSLHPSLASRKQILQLLTRAAEQAHQQGDDRAESYAVGELGYLYEQNRQWPDAQALTQRALRLAHHSPDIAYRWQWQVGRILVESQQSSKHSPKGHLPKGHLPKGRRQEPQELISDTSRQQAIAAYQEAITTLRSIRGDLVATTPEIQFSFRQSIEPIYREMVSLLIQPDSDAEPLNQARDAIEELQLAELENFFRSACFEVSQEKIDSIDSHAAVIYPILLPDRLEVLLSLPGQPLTHHTITQSQIDIEQSLDLWLQSLSPVYSDKQQRQHSQKIYDWLVRPIRSKLEGQEIQTLVFVPDGAFRNLPMAALHDGQQYLVENYQVALTPGLQLLEPRELVSGNLQTLSVGLTQARQGFDALPGVQQEMEQIQANVPAKVVLDEQFTKENLQNQLQDSEYPIVHLATHGQFSSDPEQTFLLTWDDTIQVHDIRSLLKARSQDQRRPIELLVLSACQTAAGDRQAALGLAGLAVQSGARSTLATLWSVNDRSTALLMTELYKQLSNGTESTQQPISRGASLRNAQISLIHSQQYRHPFYWSPFVLVGNWL